MSKILFQVICGSHLYGLNGPASDTDYGTVYLESMEQIFGIDATLPLPQIVTEEKDENRHWLRNFASLCKRGNPNVFEWLWAPKDRILQVDPLFDKYILSNRSAFIGLNHLTKSHFGFATSQIKKMRPENFLDDETMSSRMRSKSGKVGEARRDLVVSHGFDTKFASHAARLMIQLKDLVTTGSIVYPFTGADRERILSIKNGDVSNAAIDSILDDLKAQCDQAVQDNVAKIPAEPDGDKINEALVDFYQQYLN